jgi:hypothetical protein
MLTTIFYIAVGLLAFFGFVKLYLQWNFQNSTLEEQEKMLAREAFYDTPANRELITEAKRLAKKRLLAGDKDV